MRERLLDTGLELLATQGVAAATVRAVEAAAGAPHGSIRHHFGNLEGYQQAMVDDLLVRELPVSEQDLPGDILRRWLGPGRNLARARYEVMLLATRNDQVAASVLLGREAFVQTLTGRGISNSSASTLVAMLDGIVLDCLLRGVTDPDLGPWLDALHAASPAMS